jgi:hypothetical protein
MGINDILEKVEKKFGAATELRLNMDGSGVIMPPCMQNEEDVITFNSLNELAALLKLPNC